MALENRNYVHISSKKHPSQSGHRKPEHKQTLAIRARKDPLRVKFFPYFPILYGECKLMDSCRQVAWLGDVLPWWVFGSGVLKVSGGVGTRVAQLRGLRGLRLGNELIPGSPRRQHQPLQPL